MNLICEYCGEPLGITVEQYNEKIKEQDDKCAICEKSLEGMHFCVDFGPDGEFRGILCGECQVILDRWLDIFDGDHEAMMEHIERIVEHRGL